MMIEPDVLSYTTYPIEYPVMPLKNGHMTSAEKRFATAYAETGSVTFAGHKAGYAGQPGASMALARPAVQEAIKREQLARLNNELLPLAIATLAEILTSKTATERGKLTATTIVMKHTVGAGIEPGEGKEPHEMSAQELQDRIAALRREASERATPVIEATANRSQDGGVFG